MSTTRISMLTTVGLVLGGSPVAKAASIMTDFTEASLAATGLSLDLPNPAFGNAFLDDPNDRLVLNSPGVTNMWTTRDNAPIAYIDRPVESLWYMEAQVVHLTSDPNPAVTDRYMGGLTVYEDTNGAVPDFGYYFGNWPNSGSRTVVLQGHGDNDPNVTVALPSTTEMVTLRVEVEDDGGGVGIDRYTFFYDAHDGSGMQFHSTYDSATDNARAGVFAKARDAPNAVGFNRLEIAGIPEPGSLLLLGIGGAVGLFRRRR